MLSLLLNKKTDIGCLKCNLYLFHEVINLCYAATGKRTKLIASTDTYSLVFGP